MPAYKVRGWSSFQWCSRHRRFTFWDTWGCQTCMNDAVQEQRTKARRIALGYGMSKQRVKALVKGLA